MLIVTISIEATDMDPMAAKESIAMDMEKYGDVRVLSVVERNPQQMRIGGKDHG